jgi:phosphoglycerate dehydrogenase-like enzyme
VLTALPRLKVIAKGGSRPSSNVDIDAAERRGIRVLWTPGANAVSVAEMTLGLMLSLARDLPALHRRIVHQGWRDFGLLGREMAGTTVGLIGFGAVGREVGKRCLAFGQQVLVSDPRVEAAQVGSSGVALVGLDELLARSDVVSLHCELNASTVNLVDAAALARMKPGWSTRLRCWPRSMPATSPVPRSMCFRWSRRRPATRCLPIRVCFARRMWPLSRANRSTAKAPGRSRTPRGCCRG